MRMILGFFMSAVLVIVSGCGPSVPDEELGTVIDEVPKVEEGDEPYELPHVPAPVESDLKADKASHKKL